LSAMEIVWEAIELDVWEAIELVWEATDGLRKDELWRLKGDDGDGDTAQPRR
ncbi:hypothetical protein E4U13_008170, partial [Claviceps humidiphila]